VIALAADAAYWQAAPQSAKPAGPGDGADIVLSADDYDGRDAIWIKRPSAGTDSWGIRGTGRPEAGAMWFDKFPGKSGLYRVELGAVLDRDGNPEYRVLAGGRILGQGQYGYACGDLLCTRDKSTCPDRAAYLDLGVQRLTHDERIEVWGRATYPCPGHGAYTRWYEIRFSPAEER